MSRSITISYKPSNGDSEVNIDIRPPYFLLGGQSTSLQFWSLPVLREIGLTRLVVLGESDPIDFYGWDDLAELQKEIFLLQKNLSKIEFNAHVLSSWLAHLVYCHSLLVLTAPKDSVPCLSIG
jgi:hypothetical protein